MQTGRAYNAILPALAAHNLQYPSEPITIHTYELAHDRFLIIDDGLTPNRMQYQASA